MKITTALLLGKDVHCRDSVLITLLNDVLHLVMVSTFSSCITWYRTSHESYYFILHI